MIRRALLLACFGLAVAAQEAESGFDFHTTMSGSAAHSHLLTAAPRDGGTVTGGVRAVLYPTWKLSEALGSARNRLRSRCSMGAWCLEREREVSYEAARGQYVRGSLGNVLGVQLVTTLRPLTIARD